MGLVQIPKLVAVWSITVSYSTFNVVIVVVSTVFRTVSEEEK
jgi:hypothetical protein